MKYKKDYILAILFGGILLLGCKDTISDIKADLGETLANTTEQAAGDKTILGERLENPYTVENMRKALNELKEEPQLKSSAAELDNIEVKATHLYVRFLPQSDKELGILKQDSLLELFDYPLDFEIEQLGTAYHDPSLPDTSITYQYTAVTVDYKLPEVRHEVLAELFMLEEDDNEEELTLKNTSTSYTIWVALEDKALEISNNLKEEELDEIQLKGWFSRK